MANGLLNFKHGFLQDLNLTSPTIDPGTIYITRDEGAMYIDLPAYANLEGTVSEEAKRIRLSDFHTFTYMSDLTDAIAANRSELSKATLYFVEKTKDDQGADIELNALMKWTGTAAEGGKGFVRLNNISDVQANIAALESAVALNATAIEGNTNAIATEKARIDVLTGSAETVGSVAYDIAQAVSTIDGKLTLKADQSALNTLSQTVESNQAATTTKFEEVTGSIGTNATAIENLQEAIDTLGGTEAGSISKQIADALAVETQAREAADSQHTTDIAKNAEDIGTLSGGLATATTNIEALQNNSLTKTEASDTYLSKTDAASTYATITNLNDAKSELIGDSADTSADNTIYGAKALAQQGISDAATAQTAAEAAQNTATGAQTAITNYITSNDAALGAVRTTANNAATQTALQNEIDRATAKEGELATSISTEITNREAAFNGLNGRLATVELFFDTAATSDEVVDTLKEIQEYIASDETGAAAMTASINQNTQAIATKADQSALSAEITNREGAVAEAKAEAQTNLNNALTWGQF